MISKLLISDFCINKCGEPESTKVALYPLLKCLIFEASILLILTLILSSIIFARWIPSIASNLALSLTFKDGKQVDKKKEVSKNFDENFEPLNGYQIENKVHNLNFPPSSPSVVRDKYWFGWF